MENVDKNSVVGLFTPPGLPRPAVSVVIPMYNAEKYIGECLDSILNQTFQSFEVIVTDNCSTDSSREIVESYIPKFGGRLTLAKMQRNTGSGALPRNKGMMISCGEYIQCLDADDALTKTALEELYTLAKNYDADVVCCEKCYSMNDDGTNIRINNLYPKDLVEVPTLESENTIDRVEGILRRRFWVVSWDKLVKRKLILENEIFFPDVSISEDDIWTYGLVIYAKKFLRVPNAIYIRRWSNGSLMRTKRTPQQIINFWINPVLFGLKSLDNVVNRHEFFKQNPSLYYPILKKIISKIDVTFDAITKLTEYEIYSTIKNEFGSKFGEYDVLISALCTALCKEKQAHRDEVQILSRRSTMARLDIKMIPKDGKGDFQVLSVSDEKATVLKPDWFQKGGIGYQIQSYVGKLKIVAEATADAQIQFALKGVDIREPDDFSKRIPCWIDYTKFTVNEQLIFDTLTPVWHDKPYRYNLDAKAGKEITFEVEWLPHKSDPKPKVYTLNR